MLTRKRSMQTAAATLVAASLLAAPTSAQERAEQPTCTAALQPAAVESGAKAVRVTVVLSKDMGGITGLNAPRGAGISVAAPTDLPRTDMAASERPAPIEMGAQRNTWTVWLNTAEAKAGEQQLTFVTDQGVCTGKLKIEEAS